MSRALTALCLATTAGTAFAQNTITVPDDFVSLQDALNPGISGVAPGDIIVLRDDATFFGTFDVSVPDVTIRAAAGDRPVLDANGAGSVIKVNIGDGNVTLEGLTLQDGSRVGNNDRGAGVEVVNAGLVTIRDCLIRDNNSANFGGAGIGGSNYDLLLEDSVLRDNTASGGGAIVMRNGGDLTIRNTQFIENTATGDDGGAIFNDAAQSTVIIEDSRFDGNSTSSSGGAAFFQFAARVEISNTTFTANTAIANASADGGALFMVGVEETTMTGCTFMGNLANGLGGAVRTDLDTGAGDRVECINVRFADNESSAGALALLGGTTDIVNCEFFGNSALRSGDAGNSGGGLFFRTSPGGQRSFGRVYNSVFDSNAADQGGAILVGTATIDVVNSTFVDNSAANGAAILLNQSGSSASIFNNIFAGHVSDAVDGGGTTTAFNLFDDVDPLFVDPSNGDYSLQAGSPAIDAGSSTRYELGVFSDFAGNARVQDDPDTADTGVARTGPVIDMGAFEFDVAGDVVNDCPADLAAPFGLTDLSDIDVFIQSFLQGCP